MARLCICSGTTSGPCVTVVDGTAAGAPAAGHFLPPDHTGNVGDTWTGSTWSRLASAPVESEWSTRYAADHDAGELHEVIDGAVVARRTAEGVALEGLSGALSGALAGRRAIGVEGDSTALAVVGFGATAADAAAVAFGRSSGAVGAMATLDGDYVLGRASFWGAIHGGAFGEAGALEMIRTGGGLTEGSPLTARARIMMRDAGGSRFEALSLTHEGRFGLGATSPVALFEGRHGSGVPALALGFAAGATHTLVDDEGRHIVGHDESVEIDGDEPLVQAWSGTPPPARFARAADDAVGAILQLYKTRGVARATGDVLEADVLDADDEVGGIEGLGPALEGAVAAFGRVMVRRGPGVAVGGVVTIETLLDGGALAEVARFDGAGNAGFGTDAPEARLHALDRTPVSDAAHTVSIVESKIDDGNPLTSDNPDLSYSVRQQYRGTGPDGQVLAAAIDTEIVDLTSLADSWRHRVRVRHEGALLSAVAFGAGQVLASVGSAASPSLSFELDSNTGIFRPAADQIGFAGGGNDLARLSATFFRPSTDNAQTLGQGSLRWSTVFAATGTINTSDGREKFDLGALPIGLDFVNALQPRWFRWLDGSRRHAGLYAQDVAAALAAAGIDPATAGMWILDDPTDPLSRQGLRMDQFTAPLIRAVQELTARVAVLEAA